MLRPNLRHPNLCVANLLGEVCPIFQKFSDFSLSFGGRLKPLCLHESWKERRDALKMQYCWNRSLSPGFLACSTLHVWTTCAARCRECTWLRLISLTRKTDLSGFERTENQGFWRVLRFWGHRNQRKINETDL